MAIITVPKALREKLGEEGSDALVEMINQAQGNQKTDIIELVGETFERRLGEEIAGVNHRIDQLRAEVKENMGTLRTELKQDNANLRSEFKKDIAGLRAEFKKDIAGLRAELKTDIANSRSEIIKWMFIFWVGQVAAIAGILFMFFR